jgi:hypothetical protein
LRARADLVMSPRRIALRIWSISIIPAHYTQARTMSSAPELYTVRVCVNKWLTTRYACAYMAHHRAGDTSQVS